MVKVVNFISARALNHRVFITMCKEMNSEHIVLLLHTEVRWLSRGKVLARVFELRESIEMFLRERNSDFLQYFEDQNFVISQAYLADIFGILNSLNISLQGRGVTILEAEEKIKSFQEKLALWGRRVISGSFANFPLLDEITYNPDHPVGQSIQTSVIAHLETLRFNFEGYFGDRLSTFVSWVSFPFSVSLELIYDNYLAKDELIRMSNNQKLLKDFESMNWMNSGAKWCRRIPH